MHVRCTQTALNVYENSCTVLIYFYRRRFDSPAINQISLSQSKGWFPFILLCRWEKYHWTGRINYTNMISELYQHMYSYTRRFFTADLKQTLRMIFSMCYFCKSHELWKISTVLSTCLNWELLIGRPHRPSCFKKIRIITTTAYLIFNTVVPYPYSNTAAFDPQSFAPSS